MDELPYVPLGSYLSMTAMRTDLVDRVAGPAMFWGIRRG
jgi:peptide/nickel transport system substrate-binding protein